MVFSSLTFLFIYLPIFMLFYYLVNNISYKNTILFISSLLFYAWGEPIYVILMLISITIAYVGGIYIEHNKTNKFFYKFIVSIVISILLISLIYFKYYSFFIDILNQILNLSIANHNKPLPIGISFYTFQVISYLIDVYRGDVKAQKSFMKLGTYVALFPQLIAGPIVRYSDIQLELEKRTVSLNLIASGLRRFILGLSKKVIISNQLAIITNVVITSDEISNVPTLFLWISAIAFTFQIYFDFSGYSDMAIGLGKMLGFHFLENFNYPYISRSITEFWRRWHISLSFWFRDYVYIPLGGNKVSKLVWIRNLFIVWILTGLWHGASWNFLLWGLYYFLLLLIEKLILKKILHKLPIIFQRIYTFFFIVMGWVIFSYTDLTQLGQVLTQMFVINSINFFDFIIQNTDVLFSFIIFIPAILLSSRGFTNMVKSLFHRNKALLYMHDFLIVLLLYINIFLLISNSFNPFIYFRF